MGDYSIIQILLVFVVTFIAAIDQFSFLESLYQPIVMGPVIGAILGDLNTGLIVGGMYQLITIGNMPIGGAQPPNAVMGGIMATVFAVAVGLEPAAAAAAAIPFAMLGQYGVTLLFTFMAPMMTKADNYAHEADTKGITKINFLSMAILGTLFGLIVLLFFLGGTAMRETIQTFINEPLVDRFMKGLEAAGGMMKFVGFAMLLKVMLSKDLWGFFFAGFALAVVVVSIGTLDTSALVLLSLIGFMLAFWDYQIQTKFKKSNIDNSGGDEDGI